MASLGVAALGLLVLLTAPLAAPSAEDLLGEPQALATGPRDHAGVWDNVPNVPIGSIHMAMLPDARVLLYAFTTSFVFDPATRTFSSSALAGTNRFCSGMALLADGRLMSVGGTQRYDGLFWGLKAAEQFLPQRGQWYRTSDMNVSRWYPTAVTLAEGQMAVFGGLDGPVLQRKVEVFNPVSETWLVKGNRELPLFARGHLMPDGKVFITSPQTVPTTWDPVTGFFKDGAARSGGWRGGGASVLLDSATGAALVFSGDWAANTAELYDPVSKTWSYTGSLAHPRVWPDAVLLPDGDVLAIGGELANVPYPSEWYDKESKQWVEVATPRYLRPYHSGALLLQDGSIMAAGPSATVEIYKPWYFFAGARPRISVAPPVIAYGEPVPIVSPDASVVERAVLMRLGSVTHSLNTDQRLVELKLAKGPAGPGLVALAPALPTVAPPGYYFLFLLDGRGVPSEGAIVQVLPGLMPVPP